MKWSKRLTIAAILNIVWGAAWAGTASAAPITAGSWTPVGPTAFWNHDSWDGPNLNVGDIIENAGIPVEYLSLGGAPVAFAFDQAETFQEIASYTAWMDGQSLTEMPDGSVTYTSHGNTFNSLSNPQQFALFRYVTATAITYFLGVEDIPVGQPTDNDYNDYVVSFTEKAPTPTPEPGTLALMLAGGAMVWRRARTRLSV